MQENLTTSAHPLAPYLDSYRQMARMGDGRVHAHSVAVDIERNMIPMTAAQALLDAKDAEIAALKLEESQLRASAIYTADLCTQALADIKLKDAEIAALRLDAELGNIAMRFVDRAGDTCPDVDSAETICAEFYKAMGDAVCKARPIAMQAKAAPPAVISIAGGGGGGRSFT
jgi:hypothetical protein